ncbi:MAG: AP2/ERF family transcription factor [Xanthobacteraceae bacterium]
MAAGLGLYFTGHPCVRGHLCARLVACHKCVECQRLLNTRFNRARGHLPAAKERRARGLMCTNSSGYKGVSWSQGQQLWRAQIKVGGRTRHLGYFDTAERAHEAYCTAAVQAWGDDFKPAVARRQDPPPAPGALQTSV